MPMLVDPVDAWLLDLPLPGDDGDSSGDLLDGGPVGSVLVQPGQH